MLQLAYPLDDTVQINGTTYDIDLSFDNVLRLYDLLNDGDIPDIKKSETGLIMLIGDDLGDCEPQEKVDIFVELFENTVGREAKDNQPVDLDGNPMPSNEENEKVYSLKEDAAYIYASFMSDYGIDLIDQQGKLHWLKFRALLQGLTDGSKFLRVVEIRTMELPTGKGSGKQREQVKKLKNQYALKD